MTVEELIEKLSEIAERGGDHEGNHVEADYLLIEFINDARVKEVYDKIEKWYA